MPWVLQLIRGGTLAGLFGAAVVAMGLLVGLVAGTSILLFPLAALAAVGYVLVSDREMTPQVLGSVTFGALALFSGLSTGFGVLEVAGLIGSLGALVVLGRGINFRLRPSVGVLAVVALVLVVANLVPLVLHGGGLGHDESAYALKARHWIEETPETGWSLHRGIAMSGYGYLVFGLGGDDGTLRLLGLVAIIGLAVTTWVLGNKIGGNWVGSLAAIALLSSPALLRRSTEYLSDVPSAALLMAAMIIAWKQFSERDRPDYRLLWVLPLAWAAFYIRYQSVLSFGLIALMIAVLFWDKAKAGWRPIAAAAILGVVGLVPHFVFAASEEGSPLGIILFTADVAGREFYGEGLVDYFLLMSWPLAAYVGPITAVLFVWWLVAGWKIRAERTKCLFLMIPAVGQVLVLGVLSHGEARFIFFPLALTLVGGVAGFFHLKERWRLRTANAVSFGLAVLLLGSLAMGAAYVRGAVENRARGTEIIQAAAHELRELSGVMSCGVITSYSPQVTYLSSCNTRFFRPDLNATEALGRLDGELRYLLVVEDGKNQPGRDDLAELIDLTVDGPIVVRAGGQTADIYLFGP